MVQLLLELCITYRLRPDMRLLQLIELLALRSEAARHASKTTYRALRIRNRTRVVYCGVSMNSSGNYDGLSTLIQSRLSMIYGRVGGILPSWGKRWIRRPHFASCKADKFLYL